MVRDATRQVQLRGRARRAQEQDGDGLSGAAHELVQAEGDKAEHHDRREEEDEEEEAVARAVEAELPARLRRHLRKGASPKLRVSSQHRAKPTSGRDKACKERECARLAC